MSGRTARIVLIASSVIVVVALAFGVVVLVFGGGPLATRMTSIGGPFTLVDGNGKTVTDKDFLGKPLLVFFGYTHCPDVCPVTLFELSQVFKALGPDAGKLSAVFITVDPERDTPAVMKDYLSNFDPHIRGLTGKPDAIQQAIREYRVYAKKVPQPDGDYTMDHTALVYLMDKHGHFVAPFDLKRSAAAAAADLKQYL